MKFFDLALGARFRYARQKQIWIKISDELIAEYDPKYIRTSWTGQKICSFADSPEQAEQLKIILMEK
jgi:hypothetical protein